MSARTRIKSRRRDLNSRGRGTEEFLLVADEHGRLVWADRHPEALVVEDDWCRRGFRAAERRCSTTVELPVGLVVVEIERSVGYSRRSAPSYRAGRTTANGVLWEQDVRHVGSRRDDGVYQHVLEIEGERVTMGGA
ncbi:MAG: hypothetical protein ACOCUS_02510 [Polyangiales bacterium]